MTLDQLFKGVVQWGYDKDIVASENSLKQFAKVSEEVGEVAAALFRDDLEALEDGIGDVFVTLIILSVQNGLDPRQCLETAYRTIKDRKGKTIDGKFIKQSDLK